MDALVAKYVQGRRRDYLELGRQHFRNGEYRKACDFFKLAQSVSLEEDKALIDVKVALLQAAVASPSTARMANSHTRWRFLVNTCPPSGVMAVFDDGRRRGR